MKKRMLITCSFISSITLAQENTVSSGGTATGGNGSATYSVGQMFYEGVDGSNSSLIQGVQQPVEWFTASIVESTTVSLLVYPNPTVQQLTIALGEKPDDSFSYALYDYRGKLILEGGISEQNTMMDLAGLATAKYLLRVTDRQTTVAVIEIIKN